MDNSYNYIWCMELQLIIEKLMAKGLTQSEIAAEVGCRQPTISDIRHGKIKNPSFSVVFGLLRLAKKHGINVDEFILH